MIKVNLLNSVTDRTRSVAAVEAQVANPRARTLLLAVAVAGLMLVGMGFDWFSANSAHARAQADLKREEEIAARMASVNKEQTDLENKVKAIQTRIDAIKRLRAAQRGPVAVLSAINERIPSVHDFRLENIEQKGGELIIEGHSPNEASVTQFGRSLEFSTGLFSNVNIETERQELNVKAKDLNANEQFDKEAPKPETVHFKITCKYTPPGETPAPAPEAEDKKKRGSAKTKQLAKK